MDPFTYYDVASKMLSCLVVAALVFAAHERMQSAQSPLSDAPIVGDSIQYLDGDDWSASTGQVHIPANVPGDLLTDLQRSSIIGDPLYENNFLANGSVPIWDATPWVYTSIFNLNSALQDASFSKYTLLVFDGIKMGADIYLNDVHLGNASDQFLRYEFQVGFLLKIAANNLTVVFYPSNHTLNDEGRWMACTGGWDWAPYSNTAASNGAYTFSKGIWKSVYLVPVSTAAITHITPLIYYKGTYPTSPLTNSTNGPWEIVVRVFFWSATGASGTLSVNGSWGGSAVYSRYTSIPPGISSFNMTLHATNVNLWWPNGVGAQDMYSVSVQWAPIQAGVVLTAIRRVGFRTFALVTSDDSAPKTLQGVDGSGNLTMRFRVNGANVWSRGGNMIPVEELEGRMSVDTFRFLIQSAASANFNTLRVWGGGIFFPDAFYDAADEAGLMLYHDLMYAQQGHSPSASDTQEAEIRHQVRRLAHHPSHVIWDGCNECGGQGIYASFGMATVIQEDDSRPPWPSCPSNGWTSGVDRLWGLPNNSPAGLQPMQYTATIETHGPYQHGGGFPTVNGNPVLTPFEPNLPPALGPQATFGTQAPGVYASEFGCSVFSSFESLSPTLDAAHWGLHGGAPPDTCVGSFQNTCNGTNALAQRNYACDNIILTYFGQIAWNDTGKQALQKQLYLCMLGQALEMKSDIEARRSTNEFGTVTWQLNEIWPTGGWGSVEYGTVGFTEGQVVGGRWKPLHYFLKANLYRDTAAICGAEGSCVLKNDNPLSSITGSVTFQGVHLSTGVAQLISRTAFTLASGAGSGQFVCLDGSALGSCGSVRQVLAGIGCSSSGSDCVLLATVRTSQGELLAENMQLLATPGSLILPAATVTYSVGQPTTSGVVPITVSASATALYVHFTTLASGTFSDNSFSLFGQSSTVIDFMPVGALDYDMLTSSLRVEHLYAVLRS